jgi:hypothetical protein
MKKIAALLTGFLFITSLLQAQQKQPTFFAQLSGGPSFPLGKFAGKTYEGPAEPNPSGLAKTGLAAQLSLGYYINKSIGLLLLPGYSVHKQDPSGYNENIRSHWTPTAIRNNTINATTNSWMLMKLMAGGFLVTPLTESSELVLVTKFTAGVCKTDVPGYSYTLSDSSGKVFSFASYEKTSLPWTFCYQISVGLKYKLNNNLHLLFDISSFNAEPKKEIWYSRPLPASAGPSIPQQIKVKYKLAEVNALAGIGIDF